MANSNISPAPAATPPAVTGLSRASMAAPSLSGLVGMAYAAHAVPLPVPDGLPVSVANVVYGSFNGVPVLEDQTGQIIGVNPGLPTALQNLAFSPFVTPFAPVFAGAWWPW